MILEAIATAVVCGAIIYDVTHNQDGSCCQCESCKYLKRKNNVSRFSDTWIYNCDKFGGFDKPPKYCREYKSREGVK